MEGMDLMAKKTKPNGKVPEDVQLFLMEEIERLKWEQDNAVKLTDRTKAKERAAYLTVLGDL